MGGVKMNYVKELLKVENKIMELNHTRRELEDALIRELIASDRGDLLKLDMARIRRESYQIEIEKRGGRQAI